MDKTEKSSKILDNFLVDFLPKMYEKGKNYFCLSKTHPSGSIDVMQLNIPAIRSQIRNLFWTLFYNPDQCASSGFPYVAASYFSLICLVDYNGRQNINKSGE